MCVLCSRLLFPYLVRFRSLLVNSFQVCAICEGVFKSCLLYSMWSGLLVIPGVSTLPCVTLMLSLKTIILKYLLVCVFLVSPCCVHRDRRPDPTVSVVPSPRFVLFVFSSVLFVPVFCPSRQAAAVIVKPADYGIPSRPLPY